MKHELILTFLTNTLIISLWNNNLEDSTSMLIKVRSVLFQVFKHTLEAGYEVPAVVLKKTKENSSQ